MRPRERIYDTKWRIFMFVIMLDIKANLDMSFLSLSSDLMVSCKNIHWCISLVLVCVLIASRF